MTGYVIWLLFTAIELPRPARPLSYRAAPRNDLPALAIYGLIFLPVSMYLSRAFVRPELFVVRGLLDLPLVVRLVLYYVLADLGLYGVHRYSRNPLHHTTNLGSRLTIWDRLFGTYVNPETIDEIPSASTTRRPRLASHSACKPSGAVRRAQMRGPLSVLGV